MTYKVHVSGATAILEWYGTPTLKALESALQQLSKLIVSPPLPLLAIDHGTDFNPPTQELEASKLLAAQYSTFIGPKIALVVSKELHYGLGRMMEAFYQDVKMLFKPFRNIEDARKWLAE